MFGDILDTFRKSIDETEQIDERFYAQVIDELSAGYNDKALVGKAIAQSDGNEAKFDSIYMKLRAKALQDNVIKNMKLKQTRALQDKFTKPAIKRSSRGILSTSNADIPTSYKRGYFHDVFVDIIKSRGYTQVGYSKKVFRKNELEYHTDIDFKRMDFLLLDSNDNICQRFPYKDYL